MRTVFVFLLLANVAVLSWNLGRIQAERVSREVDAPVPAPRLVLLSEIEQLSRSRTAAASTAEEASEDVASDDARAVRSAASGEPARTAPSDAPRAALAAGEESGTAAPPVPEPSVSGRMAPGDETNAPLEAIRAETTAAEAPPDLQSRTVAAPEVSPLETGPAPPESGGADEGAARCHTLGPLKSRAVATRLLAVLRDWAQEAVLREEPLTADQYWVYFPPFESREAAERAARALREKGFTDFYVVARGALQNAVALGLFDNTEGARRRIEELRSLGFEARMAPRGQLGSTRYWIDYRLSPSSALEVEDVRSMLGDPEAVEVVQRACDTGP